MFFRCNNFSKSPSTSASISRPHLPMVLIISLGGIWLVNGNPIQVSFGLQDIIPHWSDQSMWVSLTAIMLSFCGVEIATVHANDVEKPQYAFPRALTYSVLIILVTLMLGSLSIAIVLPHNEINFVAGIMQAFHAFFAKYNLLWFMHLVCRLLLVTVLDRLN